jgi:tetratricopeptide (TPR) repeat protein
MTRASLPALLLLAAALPGAPAASTETSGVHAWEEGMTIPTYPVGPPEPNPMFYAGREYQGAQGPVYPYPLLDQLGDAREDRTYRALWLENEFVRLSILPQLGGRIFSAEDKTNGYPFFYRQHVVKPALIGMTGAWISGGVEWNVMHHHRATTFMPVQSAITDHDDGSRTVWVGETEWRDRMRWVVGVTLRPGSSVVEADVRMLNRTPLAHSVLYFANPAVHANTRYEVLFPPDVAWATFHAKVDFAPWPLARGPFVGIPYAPGTNLAFWKNHPRPVSFFVYHSDLDFMGGYDHGREAGVVHVADRETVPGKKFWTWGNGADGRMWDGILTDDDGPYIELMAGGYSDNQPDYSWIEPGEEKALVQRWFPIRDLGGLTAASVDGALDLEVAGGRARLAVNTTSVRSGARVRLATGERALLDERATIAPGAPFARELVLPAGVAETSLRLTVETEDGQELLSYAPRPRPSAPEPAPYVPPPSPAEVGSVEELVLAGRRMEQFHSPDLDPEPYYREALRRDPGDSGANAALGARSLAAGRYAEAKAHLARAVARVTGNHTRARDGCPLYLLGLALDALGHEAAARDAFGAASWDPGWRGAALLAQARLEGRGGRPSEALALVNRAAAASPRSTAVLALRAALLRHAGRLDDAFAAASRALDVDPLDPLAAHERRLARDAGARAPAPGAADELEAAALRSLDEDSYALEAAHDYLAAGLADDAAAVLEARLADATARVDPLVAYTLGFVRERQGDAAGAAALFRRGRDLPPDYCFPFRLESVPVLERAMAVDLSDPRAPYYLGNLLYDRQPERAIAAWETSRALDPAFARVHRNLAFAYARVQNDLAKAVASQERAIALVKSEPRLYYELDQYLAWSFAPLETRLARLEESPPTIARREITRSRLARLQLLLGRPDDALATLAAGRFHVWEGERGIHEVYVAARLARGRARLGRGDAEGALGEFEAAVAIPPNIEVGRAVGEHLAAVRHHVGLALQALHRTGEARAAFQASAEGTALLPENHYWIGRSLDELGRSAEARTHFDRLAATLVPAVDPGRPLERRMAEREAVARAWARRALGLAGLGRDDDARAALSEARAADAGDVLADWLRRTLAERASVRPKR